MNDLISRVDAIEAVRNEIQDFEKNYMHGEDEENFGHDIGFVAGLHRAKHIIRELPSAEAKGDLISRQDAVNTIKRYKHRLEGRGQTYGFLLEEFENRIPSAEAYTEQQVRDAFNSGYSCGMEQTKEALSAEAEWIPCSERLPENSGRYIVTLKDSWAITVRVAVYGVMPHDTHNKKVFWLYDSCYDDLDITEDVVAWMPLPTPYKGGDTE